MAIGSENAVRAWGRNNLGQLGLFDFTNRTVPVPVTGPYAQRDVDVDKTHGISVYYGIIHTWGSNQYGQLGDGTTNNRNYPGSIFLTDPEWVGACVGQDYSAGLKANGDVYTWGRNNFGQLGVGGGANDIYPYPIRVSISQVRSISCGESHMLAVRTDGTLWAWGSNGQGRLGDNTTTNRFTPVQVGTSNGTSSNWVSVSAGRSHTAGLRSGSRTYVWGNNANGQIGNGSTTQRLVPTQITLPLSHHIAEIAAGGSHTLAVTVAGSIWAWGANGSGQLGDGTGTQRNTPVLLSSNQHNWVSVKAGDSHSLGMLADGTVMSWGSNTYGQLGRSTGTVPNTRPGSVLSRSRLGQMASAGGAQASFLLQSDGTLWSCGVSQAILGQQVGSDLLYFTQINTTSPNLSTKNNWKKLSNSSSSVMAAIRSDGTLWMWGNEWGGELGNGGGSTDANWIPTRLGTAADSFWVDVECSHHCVGLKSDGSLWSWGTSYHGNTASRTTSLTPVRVGTGTNWRSAAVGNGAVSTLGGYTIALQANGSLWAWGTNEYGTLAQLNDYSIRFTPTQITQGGHSWRAVASGSNHVIAQTGLGHFYAWGDHGSGQLGLGEETIGVIPFTSEIMNVPGPAFPLRQFSATSNNNVAVGPDDMLYTWGERTNGQIGDGSVRGVRPYLTPIMYSRVGVTGGWTTFALDYLIYGWGTSSRGELGIGVTNDYRAYPEFVTTTAN